jgi:hypothetical protein
MHIAAVVVQLLAAAAGLLAAYLWWQSAQVKLEPIPSLDEGGEDGAIAFQTADTLLHLDLPKQGKLNSKAAIWTAASVGLQALATVLQIPS